MQTIKQFTLPQSPDGNDTYVSSSIDTSSVDNNTHTALIQLTVGRGYICTLQQRLTGDLPKNDDPDYGWQDTLVYQPYWPANPNDPDPDPTHSETYIDTVALAPEMRVKFQWTGYGPGVDFKLALAQF